MSWKHKKELPRDFVKFATGFAQAMREMADEHKNEVKLTIDFAQAAALISMVQLALRHPQIGKNPSAMTTKALIECLIETFGRDYPIIRAGFDRGFQAQFDVATPIVSGQGKNTMNAQQVIERLQEAPPDRTVVIVHDDSFAQRVGYVLTCSQALLTDETTGESKLADVVEIGATPIFERVG